MKDPKTIIDFIKTVGFCFSLPLIQAESSGECSNDDCDDCDDYDEQDKNEYIEDPCDPVPFSQASLKYYSNLLGLSANDIAEANMKAVRKTLKKYPFFSLLREFKDMKFFAERYKTPSEFPTLDGQRLLYYLLGEAGFNKKYSEDDLIARLKKQLIEYDAIVPGTFHPNGEITQFQHYEDYFIDFPQYPKMMESFFQIYDRLSDLFFKALKTDLSQEEINEYNLFVSYFLATDWTSSSFRPLFYDSLCKYRDLYISEGYHDLDSYLKIRRSITDFEPWRCRQFAEHKDFAQRYQDIYSSTKSAINTLCMNIKYIFCCFRWSDAPFIDDEDDDIPDEFRLGKYQEWTRLYIPKTKEELGSDGKSVALLRKMASPESKGGLKKRVEEISRDDILLFRKRLELRWGLGLYG